MSDEPLPRLDERLALRPGEAARALGVSERKLREMLPALPHIRAGGVVLIPVKALEDWLTENLAEKEADRIDRAITDIMSA